MVVDRRNAERAEVGDDHAAVEGAGVQDELGQQVKVVKQVDEPDGEFQEQTGQLAQRARDLLGVVVAVVGLDLLDLFAHLAVDVEDRIGGLKVHLDRRLVGVGAHGALDGQHHLNVLAREDLLPADEAVETGAVRAGADVGRDEQVQIPDAFPAFPALLAQPLFAARNLDRVRKLVAGVVLFSHDVGDKLINRGEGAELAAFLPVAEAALVYDLCHVGVPPSSFPRIAGRGERAIFNNSLYLSDTGKASIFLSAAPFRRRCK